VTDELLAALADERRALADQLEPLTPEQWEVQSLCSAWTVKGVAVHLLPGAGTGTGEFLRAVVRARGNVHRASEALNEKYTAAMTTAEVVAALRDRAEDRWAPPVLGIIGPYSDALIHGEDIRVPLGLTDDRAPDRWQPTLDFLVGRKARTGFVDGRVPDLWYQATDTEWQHGTADVVSGPAGALALALTGRTARLDELDGPGAEELRRYASR
jgi:uncharacterized protein (TIGR03083 family)